MCIRDSNRAIIDTIQLQADDQMLEQVVVVGYGTQKKSDLTGSVAVVAVSYTHLDVYKRQQYSKLYLGTVSGLVAIDCNLPALTDGNIKRQVFVAGEYFLAVSYTHLWSASITS